MLKIIKIKQGTFIVFEKGIPVSEITLDFNPFVKKNNLKQGLILHLRARPPQKACYWTYGIYEVEKDNYLSVDNIESTESTPKFFSDCIPELETKPTHVLIYPTAITMFSENLETALLKGTEINAVAEEVDAASSKKVKK
jgi:hypothetical protein